MSKAELLGVFFDFYLGFARGAMAPKGSKGKAKAKAKAKVKAAAKPMKATAKVKAKAKAKASCLAIVPADKKGTR